jgi:prepilin-type N-terminal cleavage/methylation domain-containing protein
VAGFTLIEVLVAVTVTGILLAAITGACYVGMQTTSDRQVGLSQSNAEQLVARWFQSDVQGACNPTSTATSCPRSPNPSTGATSACGATVVFAVDSFSSALSKAADTTVAYVLRNGTLSRLSCAYGSVTPSSTTILAQNVASAVVSYPSSGTCAGWFQLVVAVNGAPTGLATSPYTFTLCARRRA